MLGNILFALLLAAVFRDLHSGSSASISPCQEHPLLSLHVLPHYINESFCVLYLFLLLGTSIFSIL